MKKRLFSILLCLAVAVTLLPTAAVAAGRFTDVTEKDWFYADVEYAVELGLVNGMTATTYSPRSNLTYSAAIKLAACMHKKVTQGNTDFTVGSPWYQVYVDYAVANGIIPAGKTYDWNANATRAGYMEIFANAIPDTGLKNGYTELAAMNRVEDGAIPDVSMTHPQAAAIYKLYRAGILQGNDTAHNCNPDNYIQRSEVAAILTRMMNADARISFEMTDSSGMTVTQQPADVNYVAANGKAEFATAVTGGKGPYTYKWFLSYDDGETWNAIVNDKRISGVSTQKLTVKLDPSDAYTGTLYRCQISDAAGHQAVTRGACVTVENTPLTVAEHPVDVTAKSGDEVWFNAFAVGGEAPVLYQWQRRAADGEWQDFPPRNSGYETSKSNSLILVVSDIDFAAGYSYRCKMTDAAGTTLYSNAATIKRSGTRPVASVMKVTEQPQDVVCKDGDWVSFTVAVSGGKAPYTYQWQMMSDTEDWYDLCDNYGFTDTNSATLKAKATKQNFDFHCQHRCRITDANGSVVYSDIARATEQTGSTPTRPGVSVSGSLTITKQPENASAPIGEKVTFAVEISGGKSPCAYQWQYSTDDGDTWLPVANSTKYGGVSSATLTVKIASDDNSGRIYRCKISDAAHTELFSDSVTATWRRPTVARG